MMDSIFSCIHKLQGLTSVVLGQSHFNHLKENFSEEEIESIQEDLNTSKFKIKEVHRFTKNIVNSISEYNPSKISSKDGEVVRDCLEKYFKTGETCYSIYKNGTMCEITDHDIDAISEFLQCGIIQLIERYQGIHRYDIDYIDEVCQELMKIDDSQQESVINYFKTFFDTHFKAEDEIVLTPLQSKWKIVMDYCVSDSIYEVIIKWIDFEDNEIREGSTETNEKTKLLGIKLIDIDPKPYFFISKI